MQKHKYIILLLLAVLLSACNSKKKQAEILELSKPTWLKERPINKEYYLGIGITTKVGSPMLFEDKAKDKALADIASQINARISSETLLYQVEDSNGVSDYLQNRIKSSSSEFLEGYEFVDKWEDLSNVYVYYRLSKQVFKESKDRRKKEAIQLATSKFLQANQSLEANLYLNALENFSSTIDILSPYFNETTLADINGKQIDLVAESITNITSSIQGFVIQEEDGSQYLVNDSEGNSVVNLPLVFKYSGGYLVNEKLKTNEQGRVAQPSLPNVPVQGATLTTSVDLVSLGRQVTRNLYVRKIIEQQKSAQFTKVF